MPLIQLIPNKRQLVIWHQILSVDSVPGQVFVCLNGSLISRETTQPGLLVLEDPHVCQVSDCNQEPKKRQRRANCNCNSEDFHTILSSFEFPGNQRNREFLFP